MCECKEQHNARIKAVLGTSEALITEYETQSKNRSKVEGELEALQDEANLVRWKTQQNIALERGEDGKARYTNQEARDIALELNLRQNEGFQQLKQSLALKKAELDFIKMQLDFLPRRIRFKEMELKGLEMWRY